MGSDSEPGAFEIVCANVFVGSVFPCFSLFFFLSLVLSLFLSFFRYVFLSFLLFFLCQSVSLFVCLFILFVRVVVCLCVCMRMCLGVLLCFWVTITQWMFCQGPCRKEITCWTCGGWLHVLQNLPKDVPKLQLLLHASQQSAMSYLEVYGSVENPLSRTVPFELIRTMQTRYATSSWISQPVSFNQRTENSKTK